MSGEDAEPFRKSKSPIEAVDAPAPVGLFVTVFMDIMQKGYIIL